VLGKDAHGLIRDVGGKVWLGRSDEVHYGSVQRRLRTALRNWKRRAIRHGRARLDDTANAQRTEPPRGIVVVIALVPGN
jgi:hypothetical protein